MMLDKVPNTVGGDSNARGSEVNPLESEITAQEEGAIDALEGAIETLENEFSVLSMKGVESDAKHAKAEYEIYDILVKAYLFYRKVTADDPDFLTKKYEEEGIRWWEPKSNKINFHPFVRVLFRLNLKNPTPADTQRQKLTLGSQINRVDCHSIVLQELHNTWEENPDGFATDPHIKLMNVISEKSMKKIVDDHRAGRAKQTTKHESVVEVEETKKALADNAITTLTKIANTIGTANINSAIHSSKDGLVACACRYDQTSKSYQILATSSDPSVLRSIAVGSIIHFDNVVSPALRTLTEVVATQNFPSNHIPSGDRARLTGALKKWYHSVFLEQADDAKRGVKTHRRVLLRGGRDILLSAQRTDASVVTLLRPKKGNALLSIGQDEVSLRTQSLRLIEEWIINGTISARNAGKLKPSQPAEKHKYYLIVSNRFSNTKSQALYFYDIHRPGINPDAGQVDLALDGFKPTWRFVAKHDWLSLLRVQFLDPWFQYAASGNKLKREEHSHFEIVIDKAKFKLGYELVDGGNNPVDEFPMPTIPTLLVGGQVKLAVYSKDLAPVLYNMVDLTLTGDVTFEGDDTIFVIRFVTPLGSYTIAVPTLLKSGDEYKRNSKWFRCYPVKVQ